MKVDFCYTKCAPSANLFAEAMAKIERIIQKKKMSVLLYECSLVFFPCGGSLPGLAMCELMEGIKLPIIPTSVLRLNWYPLAGVAV